MLVNLIIQTFVTKMFQVVKAEMLKADLNALLALCERTDNDIRSCLNTLQVIRDTVLHVERCTFLMDTVIY